MMIEIAILIFVGFLFSGSEELGVLRLLGWSSDFVTGATECCNPKGLTTLISFRDKNVHGGFLKWGIPIAGWFINVCNGKSNFFMHR